MTFEKSSFDIVTPFCRSGGRNARDFGLRLRKHVPTLGCVPSITGFGPSEKRETAGESAREKRLRQRRTCRIIRDRKHGRGWSMTRKIIRVPSGRASLENDRLESGARKSWRRCGPAWANAFGPGPAGGGGGPAPRRDDYRLGHLEQVLRHGLGRTGGPAGP